MSDAPPAAIFGLSRRLASEAVGTAFLVAAVVGSGMMAERLTDDGALFLELGAGAEAFAAAHPGLPLIAIEFERAGDGVLVTTAGELEEFFRGR